MSTENTGNVEIPPQRRKFMRAVINGLSALIGIAMAVPAGVYLLLPPKPRKPEEWTEAGDVSKLATNEPVEMVFHRNRVDGWKVISEKTTAWVVKTPEEKVVAFAPQCPHLGCAYSWDDHKDEFVCPCHASGFGLDGRVLFGPANRPLDRYRTKVDNNKLLVGEIFHASEQPKGSRS